jgi:site-specific DNA recombinase
VPGHLLIDETEAEVVRMLYHWLIDEQMTVRQVLKRLAAGPWRPRCGRRLWSSAVVHRILSDPIYTGTGYHNRYTFHVPRRPRTHGPRSGQPTCRSPRPCEEWIPIPVPAIIDEQTHQQALAQLARNSVLSFRNNTHNDYLLRCLLTCQACGLAMFGVTHHATAGRPQYRYYQCHGKDCVCRDRERRCPRRRVKADELEAAVWAHVEALLNDPATLLEQFEAFARQADAQKTSDRAEERKWEGQLRRLDREERRLLDAYQAEVIDLAELKERRHQIAVRRQLLTAQREQLARLQGQRQAAQEIWADLKSFCERVRGRLTGATLAEKQQLLQLLIERVIVGEDTLEVRHVIPLRRLKPEALALTPPDGPTEGSGPDEVLPQEAGERLRSDGVDDAALPAGLRVELAQRLHQPQALVTDDQPHPLQPAPLQVAQERPPALGVLLGAFHHPQHAAEAVPAHPDRHQHRHVLDLADPAALQPDAVQVDVGVLPLDGPLAPLVDLGVNSLVQLADGAGADAGAPQGLGDVLHAPH